MSVCSAAGEAVAQRPVTVPRVLSIAGTDPTGGAGIQADLKSIAANGGYGMAVVTALVAQNTHGVRSIHTPPVSFLAEQLDAVSDDVALDAVKIGMLGSADVAATVTAWLDRVRPPAVVLDPVMVATSGDRLLDAAAEDAVRQLLHRVDLVTPNLPELAALLGVNEAGSWPEALEQAQTLAARHRVLVLAKGGHLASDAGSPDALVAADGVAAEVRSLRVATRNTHGTGCSLSSALATLYPRLGSWTAALAAAKDWLQEALQHADELQVGTGHGPIHHFHGVWERGLAPTQSAAAVPAAVPAAPVPAAVPAAAPAAVPAAAGPHTADLWAATAGVRERVYRLEFLRRLADGTLPKEAFGHYLAQDALYLGGYAAALARCADLADDDGARGFWSVQAQACIEEEQHLHRSRDAMEPVPQSSVTAGYLGHLREEDPAATRPQRYLRAVAAVLPCFWLYADVGARLQPMTAAGSAYEDWVQTYCAEGFVSATATAVGLLEQAMEACTDPEGRQLAADAFTGAMGWELAFFAQGLDEEAGSPLPHGGGAPG